MRRNSMLTAFDASKRHAAASLSASDDEIEAEWEMSEQIHSDHMDVMEREFQNSLSVACNSTAGLCDYDDMRAPHYPVRSPDTSYGADDSAYTAPPPPLLGECVGLYQITGQLTGPAPATCTGTADDTSAHPSCGASFAALSCTGVADEIPASCTGTASNTCTGTANQVAAVCLDTTYTDQSTCESADCSGTSCVWSPAYTPTCDLDATTDSTAACPTGCTDVAATVPACDRDGATDGTADCPAGCTVDSSASSCPPGCLFADAQTGR